MHLWPRTYKSVRTREQRVRIANSNCCALVTRFEPLVARFRPLVALSEPLVGRFGALRSLSLPLPLPRLLQKHLYLSLTCAGSMRSQGRGISASMSRERAGM